MNYEDARQVLRRDGWLLPSEEAMRRCGLALAQAAESMRGFAAAWSDDPSPGVDKSQESCERAFDR